MMVEDDSLEVCVEEAIPEARLLIECLRGSLPAVSSETDWRTLLNLAKIHGVLPLVHSSLMASRIDIPDYFMKAVQECRSSALTLAEELEHLLAIFAQQGTVVMPLKGPVLAEMLYGDVTMRPCTDLDLLVQANDFNRAEKVLMDSGWVASAPADDYQRKFVRNNILLELHFGVASPRSFPFDVNGAWTRARSSTFHGWPLKIMSEADLALFLSLHGLKHGFGKMIWILDVAHALQAIRCSPRELLERARVQGLEQVLYIGSAMVMEVLPQKLPDDLVAVLEESPEVMQSARASVERLMAAETSAGSIPETWGMYLQTEREPGKRWHRRLMYFVPTGQDHQWMAEHRLPRSLASLVRPFRLLAKYGLRRAWRAAFPPNV